MSNEDIISTYLAEAEEHLAEIESALLELEHDSGTSDGVDRVFRALHTLKGSGAMFGFDQIAAVAHELESIFDALRKGTLSVSPALIDLSLRVKDHLRELLGASEPQPHGSSGLRPNGAPVDSAVARMLDELRAFPRLSPGLAPEPAAACVYALHFAPRRELLANGSNPLSLLVELHELGEAFTLAHTETIPPLDDLDPTACLVQWTVFLRSSCTLGDLRDVFIFVEHLCELRIEPLLAAPTKQSMWYPAFRELVERGESVERLFVTTAATQGGEQGEAAGGRRWVPDSLRAPAQHAHQELRQDGERGLFAGNGSHRDATIRVSVRKLDRLVDLVGELVIAQAQLAETAAMRNELELLSLSESLERLSNELRDTSLSMRTLPFGSCFGRLRRLLRDLSATLGKEVEFVTQGGDVELDKTVIERLLDPLLHLLRNALSHGIESAEERRLAGKPLRGTIRLWAEHRAASVHVNIQDDGRGLAHERIRSKAIELGLMAEDYLPSERELFEWVSRPGFSTAEELSEVSGRGVGLDVVRRELEGLRGSFELSSEAGRGTTVHMRLPLTLAIVDGLLVAVGGERYVIPLSQVEECFELRDLSTIRGTVDVRGELLPFAFLHDCFDANQRPRADCQLVVVRCGTQRFGFVVDAVLGQLQAVIKPLGTMYTRVSGIAGATVVGDGSLALILELEELAREVLESRREINA